MMNLFTIIIYISSFEEFLSIRESFYINMKIINLYDQIEKVTGKYWQPIDLIEVNNQIIRLASFFGNYHWHKHSEGDELFYVLQGKITIHIKGEPSLELCEGELAVIPKGKVHRPISPKESYVLLVEPKELKSEGDNTY